MNKKTFFASIALIIIWGILAVIVGNEIIVPQPLSVLKAMITSLQKLTFYQNVFYTILRTIIAVALSYFISMIFALLSFRHKTFKELFQPIHHLTKTIPNVSYIIIALIWLGANSSSILVVFLILFPIFYSNILEALEGIGLDYQNIKKVYSDKPIHTLFTVELPMIRVELLNSLRTGFSLGLKVAIMSEIIAQSKYGLGREINFAKMYLDMTNIFNYTIWIIIISYLIDKIFVLVIKHYNYGGE